MIGNIHNDINSILVSLPVLTSAFRIAVYGGRARDAGVCIWALACNIHFGCISHPVRLRRLGCTAADCILCLWILDTTLRETPETQVFRNRTFKYGTRKFEAWTLRCDRYRFRKEGTQTLLTASGVSLPIELWVTLLCIHDLIWFPCVLCFITSFLYSIWYQCFCFHFVCVCFFHVCVCVLFNSKKFTVMGKVITNTQDMSAFSILISCH